MTKSLNNMMQASVQVIGVVDKKPDYIKVEVAGSYTKIHIGEERLDVNVTLKCPYKKIAYGSKKVDKWREVDKITILK